MTIPVVIPAYRNPAALTRCMNAISEQLGVRINPYVRVNDEDNLLYTATINEGLRIHLASGAGPFMLILTQDCYLKQNCLFNLVKFMEKNPNCGIAAPIQLGDTYGSGVTWGGSLDCWPAGRHIINKLPELLAVGPQKQFWANGACFLVRTTMVREIGLLDENMRFLCSDSDYSLTARSRGWDVYSVPEAQAEHTLDGSAKQSDPWLQRIKYEDMLYFTKKWLGSELFRELSHEGRSITPQMIAEQTEGLKRALSQLPPK